MSGLILLSALLVAALGAAAALAVTFVGRSRRRSPIAAGAGSPGIGDLGTGSAAVLGQVRRVTAAWRWAGFLAGAAAAGATVAMDGLGRGLLLAAPVFACFVLAGVLAGEFSILPPAGETRTATLEVRRIRDYLPRALTTVVTVAGAVLVLLVAAVTAAGSPDDLGRAGRTLTLQCTPDS
ncbi:hypothetical protein [Actinoplanes rectilineatus]|uniref:hypothetical protein n=1 Tax=Actinoplanes rectilineatus TaxID=113571 RepID=UPI0006961B2D|nr:hypothetical protein [Actinoplanes rectilineatus]